MSCLMNNVRTALAPLTLLPGLAWAEAEWELKKDDDGIQVLTRAVDGSSSRRSAPR